VSNGQEIATLIVEGLKFEDWESVYVQHRWGEAFAHFKFTAAEREEGGDWRALRFAPGQFCEIQLAGVPAIKTGVITTRQVAYNAKQHMVQLIGKTRTAWGYKSSVDKTDGNFDGKSFKEIAEEVLKPYGKIKIIGTLNPRKFKKCQSNPGETIWDFLERIARPRGIILGSDHEGNFLLIGDHTGNVIWNLIEGENIKACQCIVQIDDKFLRYDVTSQGSGGDEGSGPKKSEQRASAPSKLRLPQSMLITPAEQPTEDGDGELQEHADNEAIWHEGTIVTANITVQGWLRAGNDIWRAGDNVAVYSPMALLNNQTMKIQNATFTQDNQNGTQTMLELVVPWLFHDKNNYNIGAAPPAKSQPVPRPVPSVPAPPTPSAPSEPQPGVPSGVP
jgi:prophage tail gpP-like protein